MKKNSVELLSPAGNLDSFKAAINSGADAIYMGINKFNARQMANNFDKCEYIKCIEYAHMLNVKVYLTLNTLLYTSEIKEAMQILEKLYLAGLDAVIIQDVGLANLIHEAFPNLAMHASTQMSVYNIYQVKQLERLGFKRVVLARELTIEEIEQICKNTNLEIEVFVHGALCVCYSGQCLLSSSIGDRSANRGSCAQPCRMKYSLYDSSDKKIVDNRYILSKKDIYGLPVIKRLINAGVTSLKIEGRNKTPEYVAQITKTYKKYLDSLDLVIDKKDIYNLKQIFNRDGFCDGYFNGVRYKESITQITPKNTGIYLGEVLEQKGSLIKLKINDNVSLHDGFEIFDLNECIFSNVITCIKDENENLLNNKVEKGNYIWIGDIKTKVKKGLKVFKTSDNILNNHLKKYYDGTIIKRRKIDISIYIKDDNLYAKVLNLENDIICKLDYIIPVAINKQLSKEDIIEAFSKTQDTCFELNIKNIEIPDNIFIPISKLNELRRNLIIRIGDFICNMYKRKESNINTKMLRDIYEENTLNYFPDVSKRNINDALRIYKFNKFTDYYEFYKQKSNKSLKNVYVDIYDVIRHEKDIFEKFSKDNIYVMLPNICGANILKYIFDNIERLVSEKVKGFVIGNIGYIEVVRKLKEQYDIELIADYTLNIFNLYSASYYKNLGFDIICPSVEIEDLNELILFSNKFNIQIVSDYIEVMTSRYCILGAYVSDRKAGEKCTMPCKKEYYLKDSYLKKYNIYSNSLDCTMKLISKLNKSYTNIKNIGIRNCII